MVGRVVKRSVRKAPREAGCSRKERKPAGVVREASSAAACCGSRWERGRGVRVEWCGVRNGGGALALHGYGGEPKQRSTQIYNNARTGRTHRPLLWDF